MSDGVMGVVSSSCAHLLSKLQKHMHMQCREQHVHVGNWVCTAAQVPPGSAKMLMW
jgi:hypothetical protein